MGSQREAEAVLTAPLVSALYLIALDPGLRECGVALYELATGRLLAAWLVRSPEKELAHNAGWTAMGLAVLAALEARFPALFSAPGLAWFIGETPRLHEDEKKTELEFRMDPNTLIQTAGASAAVGLALGVRGVAPYAQQRGVDMDIWTRGRRKRQRQRAARGLAASDEDITWEELSDAERAVIDQTAKSNLHHVLDAVDLGSWFWPRWKQGNVRGEAPIMPERSQKKAQAAALKRLNLKPASKPAPAASGQVPFGRRMGAAAPQSTEGRKPFGALLRERGLLKAARTPPPSRHKGR